MKIRATNVSLFNTKFKCICDKSEKIALFWNVRQYLLSQRMDSKDSNSSFTIIPLLGTFLRNKNLWDLCSLFTILFLSISTNVIWRRHWVSVIYSHNLLPFAISATQRQTNFSTFSLLCLLCLLYHLLLPFRPSFSTYHTIPYHTSPVYGIKRW